MKKLLAILLCMVMILGLFTACGGDGNKDNDTTNADGKEVITIGIPLKTTVVDYDTNAFTLWLEEELDIDIQFQVFATGGADYMTQLSSLTLKGTKLPDIIYHFDAMDGSLWDMYGQDEYFIDLTDYMDDKEGASKIWWDSLEGVDEMTITNMMKRCRDDFGAMYVLPRIETSMIDTMDYMVSINQTWLNECNLKQPTTPDELYNVLKTFKEKYCGQVGYYPIVGSGAGSLCGDMINWIINMFLYYDETVYFGLSEDGTTLTTPFTSDKYREALAFCRKLYTEGLMPEPMDSSDIKNAVNPADGTPRVGMVVGHPTLVFRSNDVSIDNFVPISTYWGSAVRVEADSTLSSGITTDCANPDLAFKLLMLICSEEGQYRLRYGELGVDWDWADEGAVSYMGLPCTVKVYSETLSTSTQNKSWLKGPGVFQNAENETAQYTTTDGWINKKTTIIRGIYDAYVAAEETKNPTYILPKMVMSEAQSLENEAERFNTQNVVYIMRDTFIYGTSNDSVLGGQNADINNNDHWNKYLAALEKEGLSVWKAQMQEIYDEEYKDIVLGN